MRKALLGSLAAWLAGAGLALAQSATPVTVGAPTTPIAAPPARGTVPGPAVVTSPAGVPGPVFSAPGTNCGPSGCGAPCAPDCCEQPCAPCDNCPCGPPGRFWFRAEYLLWWLKHGSVPPLVTISPVGSAGVLGQPGTTVLVGDEGFVADDNPFSGGRFTAGLWLDECQKCGLEASYFFLGRQSHNETHRSSGAPGSPVLARPFFNAVTGRPDAELVAFPGLLAGSVSVSSSTRLQGAEANALHNLCCCDHGCEGGYRVDLIGGFRYLDLDERLTITEDITVLPNSPILTGNRIGVLDEFRTKNRFYGGQLGVQGEVRRGRLFANARALVALGNTEQIVDIFGATTTLAPTGGVARTLPGGLLALPTNIGHHRRDEFSVVPEAGFNVGYQVTQNLRAFVGYTFLYWSDVVRPGDIINTTVNPRQIPTSLTAGPLTGPAQPAFRFHDSDFWAQGVNFGVEVRY